MRIVNIFDTDISVPDFVRSEIKAAQDGGYKYLLVVCDTFNDYKALGFDRSGDVLPGCDYPVYCKDDDDLREKYERLDGKNMQQVVVVYQVLRVPDLSNTYCLTCGETGELHCHTGAEMDMSEILEHMSPEELAERLEEKGA